MRVYISGPMTGYEDNNFPAFHEAAAKLRALGHEVVNPAELGQHDDWKWADYLKRDLKVMLDCDAVSLLPGWVHSKGACLEKEVAERLSIPVYQDIGPFERADLDNIYAQAAAKAAA